MTAFLVGHLRTAVIDSLIDGCTFFSLSQRSRDGFVSLTDFQATTKPSELALTAGGTRTLVDFKPASEASQRLRWKDEWLQVDFDPNGGYNRDTNCFCECIKVT